MIDGANSFLHGLSLSCLDALIHCWANFYQLGRFLFGWVIQLGVG
jgi:hypothetical protein